MAERSWRAGLGWIVCFMVDGQRCACSFRAGILVQCTGMTCGGCSWPAQSMACGLGYVEAAQQGLCRMEWWPY